MARAFPPRACVVGYRYFASGGVDVRAYGERALDADVKGKRTQRVRLRVAGATLATACTCGASTMGPAACRHVWAAVLEVDKRGGFEALRGSIAPLRLAEAEAEAEAEAKAEAKEKPKPKAAKPKAAKPKPQGARNAKAKAR